MMRLISVLLLTVALATSAAGCFGKDDEPTDATPTTPTTATPTAATGTTPTAPTNATGSGNTTTPAKPAPKSLYTGTASFQSAPAPNPSDPLGHPPQTAPVDVPAGYTTLILNVTWSTGAGPGVAGSELKVNLADPTGAPLGTACTAAPGPYPAAPAVCTQTVTIPATGGAYALQWSGSGTLTAAVEVVGA